MSLFDKDHKWTPLEKELYVWLSRWEYALKPYDRAKDFNWKVRAINVMLNALDEFVEEKGKGQGA